LTIVSSIPEDAELANTYYSTYDDFEDDDDVTDDKNNDSESEEEEEDEEEETFRTDDYEALVDCMENALELQDNKDDVESTFGDTRSSSDATSIRQEKIQKLTKFVCLLINRYYLEICRRCYATLTG